MDPTDLTLFYVFAISFFKVIEISFRKGSTVMENCPTPVFTIYYHDWSRKIIIIPDFAFSMMNAVILEKPKWNDP